MIRIVNNVPLSDRFRSFEEALVELRVSVLPAGNGGGHHVSLARLFPAWRPVFASFRWGYPDVPPVGEDLLPAVALSRVLQHLERDLWIWWSRRASAAGEPRRPTAEELADAPLLAS